MNEASSKDDDDVNGVKIEMKIDAPAATPATPATTAAATTLAMATTE